MREIYDGTFSGTKISGQGIFARMLREEGIRTVDVEDLGEQFSSITIILEADHI